ncbi:peptidoglycan-binding protein [Patescibacteria group bacterium]|nr:peptidoglycan-binding protein [Patescibacteria group bacterium]
MRFALYSFIALALVVSGFASMPASAQAASLTESQIQAIISLVTSFGADATTISNINASLRGQATTGSSSTSGTTASGSACINLSFDSYLDRSDAQTNGEVTRLQQFLAQNSSIYPEARVTGYFGPATERAVQRWQAMKGLVSSGDADSTGYGYVGPKTRAAMACGGTTSNTNTQPTTTSTVKETRLTPTVTVNTSPSSVSAGQSSVLTWNSSNATRCVLKYGSSEESISVSGTKTVTPYTNTSYMVWCANDPGTGKDGPSSSAKAYVAVSSSASVTPTCALTTNKSSYSYGETITFAWTSQNATYAAFKQDTSGKDHLLLPGDKLEASGTQPVTASVIGNPSATLVVYNSAGNSSCSVTVPVTQ